MRIENKVTLQCMKKNKRRTFVTIFGVIVCVAMLSAVSIIALSMQQAMITSVKNTEGAYEVSVHGLSYDQASKIQNDEHIERSMLANGIVEDDVYTLPKLKGKYRDKIYVKDMDVKEMDLIGVSLVEGKRPTNDKEILISQNLASDKVGNVHVGDYVTLQKKKLILEKETYRYIDTAERVRYQISGIVNVDYAEQSVDEGYIAISLQDIEDVKKSKDVVLYATLKSKDDINGQIYNDMVPKYKLNNENIMFNSALLLYQNSSNIPMMREMRLAILIVGTLILIGGISLIYNAFAISLSERSRYLGMLSSVGATRTQKRNSIFFEAFLIGVIAIPLGLLCGYIGISITFYCIGDLLKQVIGLSYEMKAVIDGSVILYTVLFSIALLLLSAWIPARKASKISPIMAIRQSNSIRIRKKDIKTKRFITRLFGVEGTIALKNVKRNHARYMATLFSLIVCVVMYLGTSSFSMMLGNGVEDTRTSERADLSIAGYMSDEKTLSNFMLDDASIDAMRRADNATSAVAAMTTTLSFSHQTMPVLSKEANAYFNENKARFGSVTNMQEYIGSITAKVEVMPQRDFYEYCKQIGVDQKEFSTGNNFIFVNKTTTRSNKGYVTTSWFDIKKGGTLPILIPSSEEVDETGKVIQLKEKEYLLPITEMTDIVPKHESLASDYPTVYLITNRSSYARLLEKLEKQGNKHVVDMMSGFTNVYYTTDDPMKLEDEIQNTFMQNDNYTISIQNLSSQFQRDNNMIVLINVFLYGFITLMVIVCTTNIANTMSTGIQLRKREFAMIKSVGITPRKFTRMIALESLFYAMKALLYGLPIGFVVMIMLNKTVGSIFGISTFVFSWRHVLICIIGILVLTSLTMMYSIFKIRKDNIVETIRQESI